MKVFEPEDDEQIAASRAEPAIEIKLDGCDADLAELLATLRPCALDDVLILGFGSGHTDDNDRAAMELTIAPGTRDDAELVGLVFAV